MTDLRVLVIDDLRIARSAGHEATYARTPDEGIKMLSEREWDMVFLDHDMGIDRQTFEELTIRPVIRYIVENATRLESTIFTAITSSPVGRPYIVDSLRSAGLICDHWDYKEVSDVFATLPWT